MKFALLLLLPALIACSSAESNSPTPAPEAAPEAAPAVEPAPSTQWLVDDLITKWKNNKAYTLEILNAMPEADYGFKAADGTISYHDHAVHLAENIKGMFERTGHPGLPQIQDGTNEELIQSIGAIFDGIIAYLEEIDPNVLNETVDMWYGSSTKYRVMSLADNHLSHHRGQMVIYLRLKGIKPPGFVGW